MALLKSGYKNNFKNSYEVEWAMYEFTKHAKSCILSASKKSIGKIEESIIIHVMYYILYNDKYLILKVTRTSVNYSTHDYHIPKNKCLQMATAFFDTMLASIR